MSFRRGRLIKNITDTYCALSRTTSIHNKLGYYDNNRDLQRFYVGLLKYLGHPDIEDLDVKEGKTNFKGIDLGDSNKKMSFQITSENTGTKIKETIKSFIEEEYYKVYDRLIILILGEKKDYRANFDTQGKFSFDKKDDIWDDAEIMKKISNIKDITTLDQINFYMKTELEVFLGVDVLTDQDISDIISLLHRDFGSVKKISSTIPERTDTLIYEKNQLNGIDDETFESEIKSNIDLTTQVTIFLKDPLNYDDLNKYMQVSEAIKIYHDKNIDKYIEFMDLIEDIYMKCNLRIDDSISNKKQILYILYAMYFNCDIGLSPK
jgi:hypothetical protein